MTTKINGGYWNLEYLSQPWSLTVGSIQIFLTASALTPPELYSGHNPAESAPQCNTGYPVNCATGNQWERATDLHVPGIGLGLGLTRTYNSQAAVAASFPGMFGYGWSSSYGGHLVIDATAQTVTVVHDNGSEVVFDQNADGSYSALAQVHSSLVQNPDGSYTYTLPDRSTMSFDMMGRLTAEGDRSGNATTLSYDAQGNLTRITDPSGRSISMSHNADGTVSQATDPAGRSVSYGYDAGNLVQVTDLDGANWSYVYDARDQLTSMTDPRGGTVTSAYDGSNRVVSQTDAMNRTRTWSYPNPRETVITNPGGDVTVEYFKALLPVQITRAAGTSHATTQTIGYDDMADPTSITDGNGPTWTYTYDSAGNRTSATDPLRRTTSWTYDAERDVTSITTPLKHVTTMAYDQHGNPTSVSRTLTETGQVQTTSYGYNARGELTSKTDPLHHSTTYGYDGNGDLTSVATPLGHATTYTYDAESRLASVTTADGNAPGVNPSDYTTTFTRDAAGQVTDIADPRGHHTSYAYDANGNVSDVTDRDGRHTRYSYDAGNELTKVTRADGSTQQTAYNANGQVITQTDGRNHTTSYQRDPLGEISQVTDPLGRVREYAYDPAGNRIGELNQAGQTTIYVYDSADELVGVHYSSANPGDVSISYTADGRPSYMTDETGPTAWVYDSLDRLVQYDTGVGSWCPNTGPPPPGHAPTTTTYTWDLVNELTTIGYPASVLETQASTGAAGGAGSTSVQLAGTVTRTFDNDGRMRSVSDWIGNTTNYSYDAQGNITGIQRPDGSNATYGYDHNGATTSINDSSPNGFSFTGTYTRTPDELLATSNETLATIAASQSYGYDAIGRLNQVSTGGVAGTAGTYGYDTADNLTGQPGATSAITQAYDAAGEITTANGGDPTNPTRTYTYDTDGNRTSTTGAAGTQTYNYDQADRLASYISATQNTGNSQTGSHNLTSQYSYDGTGLRTQRIVNGVPTIDAYDIAAPLPVLLVDGTTSYVYGPDGLPIEQIVAGTNPSTTVTIGSNTPTANGIVRYYHHDQLGSTRALTDANGHPVTTYSYNAYGQSTSNNTSLDNPLLYAGQYTDPQTGLQYLRARYYDPATGQFISRDPLEQLTRQPYSYAGDNPINEVDPSGLCGTGSISDFLDCADPTSSGNVAYRAASAVGLAKPITDVVTSAPVVDAAAGAACLIPGEDIALCAPAVEAAAAIQTANVAVQGAATNFCDPASLAANEAGNLLLLYGGAYFDVAAKIAGLKGAAAFGLKAPWAGLQGTLDYAQQHGGP